MIRVRDLGDLRDLCAGAVGPFQSLDAHRATRAGGSPEGLRYKTVAELREALGRLSTTRTSAGPEGPAYEDHDHYCVRDLGDLRDLCAGAVGPFQSLEAPVKFFVGSGANSVSFELDSPELLVLDLL